MNRPPFYYDYQNRSSGTWSPSEIHARDNMVTQYYERYFYQKAMSPFKFTFPEWWADNYALYTLYCWGFFAIILTDKFGIIPQACGLEGYNVFYQPTHVIITNPLLKGTKRLRIDTESILVKLQPNYNGINDIVHYYATLMALCYECLGSNLINSKLAFAAVSKNKAAAESLKKIYDQIASGVPAVFYDRNLENKDINGKSQSLFEIINPNLKNTYISSDLINTMREIELSFNRDIGIPTVNETKGERLIKAEVERNSIETQSKCSLWLEEIQKSFIAAHKLFGLTKDELWVDWRREEQFSASDNLY